MNRTPDDSPGGPPGHDRTPQEHTVIGRRLGHDDRMQLVGPGPEEARAELLNRSVDVGEIQVVGVNPIPPPS